MDNIRKTIGRTDRTHLEVRHVNRADAWLTVGVLKPSGVTKAEVSIGRDGEAYRIQRVDSYLRTGERFNAAAYVLRLLSVERFDRELARA